MLRVTIELVPYGVEEMAKTISELCIANVGGDQTTNVADYEVAGYEARNGKITEFAVELNNFPREGGALELVRQVLSAERSEFEKVKLAERLLQRTRLLAETGETE